VARRRYVDHDGDAFEEQLRRAAQTLVRHDIHRERVVHWGLTSDRAMTADVMAEVMVTDLRGDLKDVRAPVDVIYAWDRATPATRVGLDQIYQSTYAGLRGGRRLRIDDARHYVMLDQPGPFYAAMREWLARPAPAAR
jgi:pimeloyl-ACP methyl ester carboxylesterase